VQAIALPANPGAGRLWQLHTSCGLDYAEKQMTAACALAGIFPVAAARRGVRSRDRRVLVMLGA
jgi:hypothetical protein